MPPVTHINKYLLIGLGILFILNSISRQVAGFSLDSVTGLRAESFFAGHIYQILTYPLILRGLMEAIFDGLILWFIGGELELLWGSRRYLKFLAFSLLVGGVCFLSIALFFPNSALYQVPLSGLHGATGALCIAYGYLFPERLMFFFFFPLKAKYFAMLLVGVGLYQGLFSPAMASIWGSLGAYAYAFWWVARPLAALRKRRQREGQHRRGLSLVKKKSDDDITYH